MTSCILAIDDEPALLDIITLALEPLQYEVRLAHNGAEGLHKVKEFKPDLILLDIMMPKMDGWEALGQIRQLSNVPVIMLSARVSDDTEARALEAGANDYIAKPVSIAKLRIHVNKLLRPEPY